METEIQKKITEPEAFEAYLLMGAERSLAKLWGMLGDKAVALRTLEDWSSKKGWVAKADEYDKARHDEIMKIALKKAVKSKADILMICQSVFGRFSQELIGEEVVIKEKDRNGNITNRIVMNRYRPDMADVERAYRIIKQELGEGLSEWGKQAIEININKQVANSINLLDEKSRETVISILRRGLERSGFERDIIPEDTQGV